MPYAKIQSPGRQYESAEQTNTQKERDSDVTEVAGSMGRTRGGEAALREGGGKEG